MKYLLFLSIPILFIACKTEYKSQKVKTAYEQVMKIHDDIMPEMTTINKFKRKLKKQDGSSEEALNLMKSLTDANEGMMQWMSDFDHDNSATEQIQLDYLASEKKKIQKVSDDMTQAMKDAEAYLNKTN